MLNIYTNKKNSIQANVYMHNLENIPYFHGHPHAFFNLDVWKTRYFTPKTDQQFYECLHNN